VIDKATDSLLLFSVSGTDGSKQLLTQGETARIVPFLVRGGEEEIVQRTIVGAKETQSLNIPSLVNFTKSLIFIPITSFNFLTGRTSAARLAKRVVFLEEQIYIVIEGSYTHLLANAGGVNHLPHIFNEGLHFTGACRLL
jgi:hypothetical protein